MVMAPASCISPPIVDTPSLAGGFGYLWRFRILQTASLQFALGMFVYRQPAPRLAAAGSALCKVVGLEIHELYCGQ